MNEFEQVVEFLKTKGLNAFEEDLMVIVEAPSRSELGKTAIKVKALLNEYGYKKSWGVRPPANYVSLEMDYEERHSYD